MGLFNFLKRKQPPPPADDGPSPEYMFAHVVLRQIALDDPLQFLAAIASPAAEEVIDSLLKIVAEECGRPAPFGPADIAIHTIRVNDFPCAVIELPEPRELAEAHFVALTATVDMSDGEPPGNEPVPARYFTLEKGIGLDDQPRTVLCEWNTSTHMNYGDGPPPTVDDFAEAIGALL